MAHRLRTTALNFPIYPSLLSCKLMASIFINCCYIHLCMNISICIPKDINTDCLVYIMLLVCVFLGLTIWYWIIKLCFLLGKTIPRNIFLFFLFYFKLLSWKFCELIKFMFSTALFEDKTSEEILIFYFLQKCSPSVSRLSIKHIQMYFCSLVVRGL